MLRLHILRHTSGPWRSGYRIRPIILRNGLLGHIGQLERPQKSANNHRRLGQIVAEQNHPGTRPLPESQTLYYDSALDFVRLPTCRWIEAIVRVAGRGSFASFFLLGEPEKTSSWLHYTTRLQPKPPEGRSSHRNQAHRNPTTMFLPLTKQWPFETDWQREGRRSRLVQDFKFQKKIYIKNRRCFFF